MPFRVSSAHFGLPVVCLWLALPAAAAEPAAVIDPLDGGQDVALIHSPPEILSRQGLPNFVGISANSVGARGLSMNLVVIPPGAAAEAHTHANFESAIYVLEGRVETRYGAQLEHSVITEAGDFLFIPPNVPHQPVNLSGTQQARAIVARNDPAEQEHVIPYTPQPAAPTSR